MSYNIEHIERLPADPGVYLMKAQSGTILYIGKAKNLKKRVRQYFAKTDDRAMVPHLISSVSDIDFITVPSEKEALLLENTLIKRHRPKFNVLLKDDKTFVSLMINHRHEWPSLHLVRYKGKPKGNALHFGPYTNALAARQIFELMTRLFPLRQCSDQELKRRTRPCLLYGIKRCIAPCVGKCSHEEYDFYVQGAIQFLQGKSREIVAQLREAMQKASDAEEFEKAAALLQTLRQIERIVGEKESLVVGGASVDCDAIALHRGGYDVMIVQLLFRGGSLIGSEHFFFEDVAGNDEELLSSFLLQHYQQDGPLPKMILLPLHLPDASLLSDILSLEIHAPQRGEKKALVELAKKNAVALFHQEKSARNLQEKLLLDLSETLHLNRYPKRIECFDTSNISGSDLVAALVTYVDGVKDKKRTRTFIIRGIDKGDDYAALHQALSRRLIRAKEEEDLPDLLLIDGGKGQLNVARDVLAELDIASVDLVALAKEEGRHDRGIRSEALFLPHHKEPLLLDPRSPLLMLLQQIRDETHETALAFHKKRRKKRTLTSALDSVAGIGPIKRQRLLSHFGSVERIRQASDEALLQVQGISQKDIRSLRKALSR